MQMLQPREALCNTDAPLPMEMLITQVYVEMVEHHNDKINKQYVIAICFT